IIAITAASARTSFRRRAMSRAPDASAAGRLLVVARRVLVVTVPLGAQMLQLVAQLVEPLVHLVETALQITFGLRLAALTGAWARRSFRTLRTRGGLGRLDGDAQWRFSAHQKSSNRLAKILRQLVQFVLADRPGLVAALDLDFRVFLALLADRHRH